MCAEEGGCAEARPWEPWCTVEGSFARGKERPKACCGVTVAFAVHVSFEACNVLFPKSVAFSSFVIAIDGQGESAHTLVVTVKMQKLEIIYS
jgi:hypothetical protein